jgi:hypothetical protein
MMDAESTSETNVVNFYQATRRNIPEGTNLHSLEQEMSLRYGTRRFIIVTTKPQIRIFHVTVYNVTTWLPNSLHGFTVYWALYF